MIRIAVLDGQGGGIGATVIKKVKEVYGEKFELWALGTNAIATAQMMKARANRGATGEHAIAHCLPKVDIIVGPISIVIPYSMMGEVTPTMVAAIGTSPAIKFLLPLTQEPVIVVGSIKEPLPHLVETLVCKHLRSFIDEQAETPCP